MIPLRADGTKWTEAEYRRSIEVTKGTCGTFNEPRHEHTEPVENLGEYNEAKFDQGKVRYSLIDPKFLEDVAKVMTMGAEKYSEESWKTVPNGKMRYKDALWRHITSNGTDDESGISHLAHAACNLMFLHYLENKDDQV